MTEQYPMKIIARIRSAFPTKFGIPRQSGLIDELQAAICFEPDYRNEEALRGIEGFSHLWLIWQFSEAVRDSWSPTVRPPRLGGNQRMGVFATRSPFRPNAIGLSSVRLLGVERTAQYGTVLHVAGADLMDGTPIFDIKPYLPFTDSHADATGGFAAPVKDYALTVDFPATLLSHIPAAHHAALQQVLAQDPRPSYQSDPTRVYSMEYADWELKFTVDAQTLHVTAVTNRA